MEEEHKFPHMEEEHKFPHMEEEHKFPHMEEEHKFPHMEEHHMEEEHRLFPMEEETGGKKPSPTPSGDKKAAKAMSKDSKRPDINRHHMDDGRNGLYNRNTDAINPININVSYNNNRPLTVNDFNDPNVDVNGMRNGGNWDRQKKKTPTASFGMENNLTSQTPADEAGSLLSPVNQTTVNTALEDMNQRYYPAYLENPLNKNQPGVNVKSIFETQNYQNQLRQQKLFNQRANRQILQRKPHWTQSNYETTMMNRILSEQNDPAPVILDRPWSEWKSAE
jgi:hypothetical protein